jgi:hypothetical protein
MVLFACFSLLAAGFFVGWSVRDCQADLEWWAEHERQQARQQEQP